MPEGFMPSKRSPHLRRLLVLAMATCFIVAVEVSEPPLLANPPRKPPVPTIPKAPKTNWFGINWSKLIPKSIPKIHIPAMKKPKAAHIPKLVPKQPGPARQQQANIRQLASAPNAIAQPRMAAQKPQPIMKPALHELSEAWLYINASPLLATRSRNAVSGHIGQALTALGGAMPKASATSKKGNHLKLAEEHLHKANKEVLLLSHLPPETQKAVLKEIKSATDLVKKHANAGAGNKARP
jgi:hypothetical protein